MPISPERKIFNREARTVAKYARLLLAAIARMEASAARMELAARPMGEVKQIASTLNNSEILGKAG